MLRLYFVRHGESEFNKARRWAGSTDTPLTQKGHTQAKQAARQTRSSGVSFDVIISSPLKRARQTAEYFAEAHGYPADRIELNSRLIERDFGKLEGNKDLVASAKYLLDESAIDDYEDVESLTDLQKRANEMLAYLYSLPHETILVVGHGAFGRALRRAIKNEPLSKRGKAYDNAEIVRLI